MQPLAHIRSTSRPRIVLLTAKREEAMSRRAAHLHGRVCDAPDLSKPRPAPPFPADLERALTQLAYVAHVTANISLADRAVALREIDAEIAARQNVLAHDSMEQTVAVWERLMAAFMELDVASSSSSASSASGSDGDQSRVAGAGHLVATAGHARIAQHLMRPKGPAEEHATPEARTVHEALQPFLAGLTEGRLVAAAQAHVDSLGKSTIELAQRGAKQMRWHVLAGLRQALRRREAVVADVGALHDGLRPWHTGVCRSPAKCLMCSGRLVPEKDIANSEVGEAGKEHHD